MDQKTRYFPGIACSRLSWKYIKEKMKKSKTSSHLLIKKANLSSPLLLSWTELVLLVWVDKKFFFHNSNWNGFWKLMRTSDTIVVSTQHIIAKESTNITEKHTWFSCRPEVWCINQLKTKMRFKKRSQFSLTLVQYSFEVSGFFSSINYCQWKRTPEKCIML